MSCFTFLITILKLMSSTQNKFRALLLVPPYPVPSTPQVQGSCLCLHLFISLVQYKCSIQVDGGKKGRSGTNGKASEWMRKEKQSYFLLCWSPRIWKLIDPHFPVARGVTLPCGESVPYLPASNSSCRSAAVLPIELNPASNPFLFTVICRSSS